MFKNAIYNPMKSQSICRASITGIFALIAFSATALSIYLLNSSPQGSTLQVYSSYYSQKQTDNVQNALPNIDIPQTNIAIESFWHHKNNIQLYTNITNINIHSESETYSYSYTELQKMYKLFGCDSQQQINCQNGISKNCPISDYNQCDLPKLVNYGKNCDLNDLKDITINTYKKNQIPKIYHIVLQFKANDIQLPFFQIMYYLSMKSFYKYGNATAIILHYIVINKNNSVDFNFNHYENEYFQNSLQYITHFCEWNYVPTIFGNGYTGGNHQKDASSGNILRLFTTTMFGGIYYDLDVFMFDQTQSEFNKLLTNNPSHTILPKEKEPWPNAEEGRREWWLCSCITIAKKWSMFNIEWIYQLNNKRLQLKWNAGWAMISVQLPKRIADDIFNGNDSWKYINELDSYTYFDAQYFDDSPWVIENNSSLWCHKNVSSYGFHYCNNGRMRNVKQYWETSKHNLTLAKKQTQIPFTKILRHIEDDVPLC